MELVRDDIIIVIIVSVSLNKLGGGGKNFLIETNTLF